MRYSFDNHGNVLTARLAFAASGVGVALDLTRGRAALLHAALLGNQTVDYGVEDPAGARVFSLKLGRFSSRPEMAADLAFRLTMLQPGPTPDHVGFCADVTDEGNVRLRWYAKGDGPMFYHAELTAPPEAAQLVRDDDAGAEVLVPLQGKLAEMRLYLRPEWRDKLLALASQRV